MTVFVIICFSFTFITVVLEMKLTKPENYLRTVEARKLDILSKEPHSQFAY